MIDDDELGLARLATRALLATIDEKTSPHRIALKPRVILEAPKAFFSSQYLCGTAKPATSHVVHDVKITDCDGGITTVRALIDCGATSILVSPKLVRSLGLETFPAYIATLGLDGKILEHARDSRRVTMRMQYLPHLAPVDESDALVVKMTAYDLVLGLPWFERHEPEIDWARKRLLSLRMTSTSRHRDVERVNSSDPHDRATAESHVAAGTGPEAEAPIAIEMLSASLFEKLLAGTEASEAFAIRLWQGTGLLGGAVQGSNLYLTGETPHVASIGAGVVGIAAAEAGVLYALCCSL